MRRYAARMVPMPPPTRTNREMDSLTELTSYPDLPAEDIGEALTAILKNLSPEQLAALVSAAR